MSGARESTAVTLLIAAAVALFCSALVSGAVYVLRPIQSAYALVERNRLIVELATGMPTESVSDAAVVQKYLDLDARVLNLDTGEFVAALNGHTFDHWHIAGAQAQSGPAEPAERLVPVYFVREHGNVSRLVLPIDGRGMWSTIYGYVALEADLNTIAGVGFYQHGETPGIGDRIQTPAWRATWVGKEIYDAAGVARIRVGHGEGGADVHEVDLITGASVTSGSVGRIVNEWFGAGGYGPWLARLRHESSGEER